eukprot:g29398.t1
MLAGRCRCSLWGQRLARNRLQESRSISRKKLTSLKTPDFFSRRSFCSNEPTRRFKEFQEMLKDWCTNSI